MGPNFPRRHPHNIPRPAAGPMLPLKRSRRPSPSSPETTPPPPPQIYSTVRPTIGFDLNLQHRLLALERRAELEPAHCLVRVQGTIVLSRVALPEAVRTEMEGILAPTEILFLTWTERFGRIDVARRRGGDGGWRVEMCQGPPTGIPLIRDRVEFTVMRRGGDGKGEVVGGKGEMDGNMMVWGGGARERGELFVRVVSGGQTLAELEARGPDGEKTDEEEEEEEARAEEAARQARTRARVSSRRRIETPRTPQPRQATVGRAY
ncbi:uncharacterized protein DNG_06457 [Cephalotrichum gorgonifer]|uniref:Uncharacterized protein n=1 Tax=Cephalotrichum gorgonifer TaxID=2041049 RepID=A0AAE8N1P6_9PEZI|nr:uncharacterized protein DNG_06457 [Cephalotrichum gorgonifer]